MKLTSLNLGGRAEIQDVWLDASGQFDLVPWAINHVEVQHLDHDLTAGRNNHVVDAPLHVGLKKIFNVR